MGKYMKKSHITADVSLTEFSQSASSGVRTRAKTLALQRLGSPPPPPSNSDPSSSSYLQLRSLRLEKPPPGVKDSKRIQPKEEAHHDSERRNSRVSGKGSGGFVDEERELLDLPRETEDLGVEVSCGENYLDFEQRGSRGTRESTPCNLIRDSETIETPGSTTRRTSSARANRRATNNILQNIPTTHEMEEFFSCAEQEQQRLFIEKYNFDVANDLPLAGRYEWVQVIP